MSEAFIPVALAVAPNPLGLPSNLKLTTIPIDAYTCFELWMPEAHGVLLPEEAMLLRGDCSRLEEICARLTNLLGATLVSHAEQSFQVPVDRWQHIRSALYETGANFDAIAVTYLPQVIHQTPSSKGVLAGWTLQQAGWSVSFLTLQPTKNGFHSSTLPIDVVITSGQSMTKGADRLLPSPLLFKG
jgi:hypothetical protein